MFRPKLLCVDDDAPLRELYRTALDGYGYEVVVAENGANALQVFNSLNINAVILDYQMPLMNGSEVAATMKEMKPGVPIIMVSGSESVVEGVPPFVDAALPKGSELGLLLDKLELLMGPGNSQADIRQPGSAHGSTGFGLGDGGAGGFRFAPPVEMRAPEKGLGLVTLQEKCGQRRQGEF